MPHWIMATVMIEVLPDGKHFTVTELGQEQKARFSNVSSAFTEAGLREELQRRRVEPAMIETLIHDAKRLASAPL